MSQLLGIPATKVHALQSTVGIQETTYSGLNLLVKDILGPAIFVLS